MELIFSLFLSAPARKIDFAAFQNFWKIFDFSGFSINANFDQQPSMENVQPKGLKKGECQQKGTQKHEKLIIFEIIHNNLNSRRKCQVKGTMDEKQKDLVTR